MCSSKFGCGLWQMPLLSVLDWIVLLGISSFTSYSDVKRGRYRCSTKHCTVCIGDVVGTVDFLLGHSTWCCYGRGVQQVIGSRTDRENSEYSGLFSGSGLENTGSTAAVGPRR